MCTPSAGVSCALVAAVFCASGVCLATPSAADLDAIAKRVIAQEHVAGASVLVAQAGRILLHKGYGFADVGLEAPTKEETAYRVVGPMMPFTGIAIMQQVERGKLSLDDDVSKFIPEFPLQGHHVTVRQLLNHTSGIIDYHYLGDAIEGTSRQPKALDEVMALYSGQKWMNEPGTKWDWSISGFQLLVTILERVTGQTYDDYVQQNIFAPAGARSTIYCDDFTPVRGLSHGYRGMGSTWVPSNEDAMAYNYDLRYCSTVGDLYQAWKAVGEKKLVKPETLKLMSTAVGPTMQANLLDPEIHYGLALNLNHEDSHRSIGQHGSLLGYSGNLYEFPEDQLTVVVLTNTRGQNAWAISRALSRAIIGLPPLPAPKTRAPERILADKAVSAPDRASLTGTFVLKYGEIPPTLHDSYSRYRRTYRVFDENGRLMIEPIGEGAERLLKQEDGSFAMRSSPGDRITFVVQKGHAAEIKMKSPDGNRDLSGARIGDGDVRTFHQKAEARP